MILIHAWWFWAGRGQPENGAGKPKTHKNIIWFWAKERVFWTFTLGLNLSKSLFKLGPITIILACLLGHGGAVWLKRSSVILGPSSVLDIIHFGHRGITLSEQLAIPLFSIFFLWNCTALGPVGGVFASNSGFSCFSLCLSLLFWWELLDKRLQSSQLRPRQY